LCFPEDNGLSRQHLAFEPDGDTWVVLDTGSKNGTLVNGERVTAPRRLNAGDQVLAGHLSIFFGGTTRPFTETVVFIDTREDKPTATRRAADVLPAAEKTFTSGEQAVSADKVGALIRAGRELAGHRPLAELFPLILDLATEAVHAERGVLLTLEGDNLVVKASSGGYFRISAGVRDRVLKDRTSILVNDVLSDEAFRGMQSLVAQQVRMLMAVPLQTNAENVIGLIYVDSPTLVREFTVEDLNLLTVMANVAAIRIEHARLAEIEQAERILAKDLEQAAIIQQQLLPSNAPDVPGVEIAGYNAACRTVGGDYYDFITYPDGRLAIALGDVSGKAMPAALMMTSLHARVRVLAEKPTDVADLITRLNRHTAANCPSNRFITFFFSLLDPRSGEIVYSNAGHNPPMLARLDGTIETLEGGGLVMGLFPKATYEAHTARMRAGDVLVLFSDGVTEATNARGEEFEEAGLMQVLRANRHKSATEVAQAIISAVAEFVDGAPAADDLTIVVVRKTS
jgi:serine phosphatase RsbU (regulator of sigma subunit)